MNNRIIRIAWTFDDGPTRFTSLLNDQLARLNVGPVTWFICRHNVTRLNYMNELLTMQAAGAELAIHEIHPSEGAVNWLKRRSKCYKAIEEAMADFLAFYNELHKAGIHIRFVRLPGGELSELMAYLQWLDCQTEEAYHWATKIIDGAPVPDQYRCVQQDYNFLLQTLDSVGVKIWAGAPQGYPLLGGLPFHYNSWQAECAGICEGRGADNITMHQSPLREKAGIEEWNFGVFEKSVMHVIKNNKPASIVVLAHDTTYEDMEEVVADIKQMEEVAHGNKVQITYYTMSSLFNEIR